jgi:hypothetical protein
MKLQAKLRHPVVQLSLLILVLGLATEGEGFDVSLALSIFSKITDLAAKAAGNLAGHTWNVVAFKLTQSGWDGLLNAIFPKEDKVAETLNEILDRFDQVENLVRRYFCEIVKHFCKNSCFPGHDHHNAHDRSCFVEPDDSLFVGPFL